MIHNSLLLTVTYARQVELAIKHHQTDLVSHAPLPCHGLAAVDCVRNDVEATTRSVSRAQMEWCKMVLCVENSEPNNTTALLFSSAGDCTEAG